MNEYIKNMRKYIGHERLLIDGASVVIHKKACCSCKSEKTMVAGVITVAVSNLVNPLGGDKLDKQKS